MRRMIVWSAEIGVLMPNDRDHEFANRASGGGCRLRGLPPEPFLPIQHDGDGRGAVSSTTVFIRKRPSGATAYSGLPPMTPAPLASGVRNSGAGASGQGLAVRPPPP